MNRKFGFVSILSPDAVRCPKKYVQRCIDDSNLHAVTTAIYVILVT